VSSPPARGFLWHGPPQVKALSMITFQRSPVCHFHEHIPCAMCMYFIVTYARMPDYFGYAHVYTLPYIHTTKCLNI
jgi:hypothetical protein